MILEHAKITILGKFIRLPPLLLFAVGMKKRRDNGKPNVLKP